MSHSTHKKSQKKRYASILLMAAPVLFLLLATTLLSTHAALADSTETFAPSLTIPIPNVSLSGIKTSSTSGYVDIPWMAEYITGVYKYSVYLAGLLATVMFMVGGFQYLTAGGDASRVSAGKKRATDAIVGMLLVLGAYAILNTVNPGLVSVTALRVPLLEGVAFAPYAGADLPGAVKGTKPPVGVTPADRVSMDKPYTSLTVPPQSDCPKSLITQSLRDAAMKVQHETGIPAAGLLAQYSLESADGRSCIGPTGKNFNCFGIICFASGYKATWLHQDAPPTCPSSCSPAKNGSGWICWQTYNSVEEAFNGYAHSTILAGPYKGWEQYNGTAEGFERFIGEIYAGNQDYANAAISRMKINCLVQK